MADISLCANALVLTGILPACSDCRRNPAITQPSEHRQSYVSPSIVDGACKSAWPTRRRCCISITKEAPHA